jgi:hypothetical protein
LHHFLPHLFGDMTNRVGVVAASDRKDSTPRDTGRLLRCGISVRPMSGVGHQHALPQRKH